MKPTNFLSKNRSARWVRSARIARFGVVALALPLATSACTNADNAAADTTVAVSAGRAASASASADNAATNPESAQSSSNQTASTSVVTKGTNMRTINVNGAGKKSQAPDQVTITMGVETQGENAAAALKDNNTRAAALIALLKNSGVADKDLQTSNLSVYPRYDDQGRKIVGYTVSNMVTATLKDLKSAGTVIDAAAGAAGDAIRVQGLSFGLSDTSEAIKVARERAVADGRLQAEQLAAAAGVKLGRLLTMSTSSIALPTPVFQQRTMAAASADAVPLEGGAQEVTANVEMIYEIAD